MPVRRKRKTQDLDFQMEFYENILKEKPDFIEALMALGEIYTKKGLYEKGLKLDQRLIELRPDNPMVHYNLACSLSLTGDIDEAFRAIERAVVFGYSDIVFMNQDPDLDNLRKDERYQKLLKKIGSHAAKISGAATSERRRG